MIAIQCKMARTALNLGVRQLAELADVSPDTIARLERGDMLKESTIANIRATLERAGVVFVEENGEGPGVRLKKKVKTPEQLASKIADLHEALPVVDEKAKPSPHKAMKQLEHAHAKNEIAKAKEKHAKLTTKIVKPKS